MNNKIVYQPKGKALEYSQWAANFYNGCSARCEYCYNRHGRSAKVVGGDVPTLKKSLVDEETAYKIFTKEAMINLEELRKHGLFFNFVSDPCLPETMELNFKCAKSATSKGIPVKFLTKQADWVNWFIGDWENKWDRDLYSFGFTLTGHDELEQGAATNRERIEAMKKLHDAGLKTWASIEPVIDIHSSMDMIDQIREHVDLIKIGLLAGKHFNKNELRMMFTIVNNHAIQFDFKVYWKATFLKQTGINRIDLPSNCVTRDFIL